MNSQKLLVSGNPTKTCLKVSVSQAWCSALGGSVELTSRSSSLSSFAIRCMPRVLLRRMPALERRALSAAPFTVNLFFKGPPHARRAKKEPPTGQIGSTRARTHACRMIQLHDAPGAARPLRTLFVRFVSFRAVSPLRKMPLFLFSSSETRGSDGGSAPTGVLVPKKGPKRGVWGTMRVAT